MKTFIIDNQVHYEVEKILKKKKYKGKIEYLVQWKDYDKPTWEPLQSLQNCPKILEEFSNSKKRKFENTNIISKTREKRTNIPDTIKKEILERDNTQCQLCLEKKNHFEYDHVIPLYYHGTNSKENIQLLCHECHKFKSSFLDNHIISKIIQSSLDTTKLTRNEIMKECMTIYYTRNIHNIPKKIDEILAFIAKTYPLYESIKKFS